MGAERDPADPAPIPDDLPLWMVVCSGCGVLRMVRRHCLETHLLDAMCPVCKTPPPASTDTLEPRLATIDDVDGLRYEILG